MPPPASGKPEGWGFLYLGGSMANSWIYLTNWDSHIHYRDRGAAWIKAHIADLNDYQWIRLPDAVKGQLTALRYLAARGEGKVPDDPAFLSSQCGCTEPLQLERLIEAGFLTRIPPVEQSASTMLAKRYPHRKKEREISTPKSSEGETPVVALTPEQEAEADADLDRKAAKVRARLSVSR